MSSEPIIILLFIIASGVAVSARRWHIPYTVALVLVGLGLGYLHLLKAPELTHDLVFLVFLPGLIFEAAYHINFDELWRDRLPILSLAVPGVGVSIGLTAALLVVVSSGANLLPNSILPPVGWPLALLFGAAIAATDPIAVIAIFKQLGAPRRLDLLTEGESLLNDGTAIVLFGLMLAWVLGGEMTPESLVIDFGRVVGGGLLAGGIVGLLVSFSLRQIDDPMVEIMLTSVAAYGSFLIADQLEFSGVISTVVAGLICGNYGAQVGMSPSTRIAVNAFWEYIGFALNSLIFLLMGLEIDLDSLLAAWPFILLAYLAVTLARFTVVCLTSGILAFTRARIPAGWCVLLSWGGIRGALSMVLVLSLPLDLPERGLIVNTVFGVVVLSILIQGTTISWLGKKLHVFGLRQALVDYEAARARISLANRMLRELEHMENTGLFDEKAIENLTQIYRQQASEAQGELKNLDVDTDLRFHEDLLQLSRRILQFERLQILESREKGRLSALVADKLLADNDARLLKVESGSPLIPVEPATEPTTAQDQETDPPDQDQATTPSA